MGKSTKFPQEVRERAIRLVSEQESQYGSLSSPMINCRNSPTRTCRFLSKNKGHSLW
jgi:hypothetical protein